MNLDGYDRKILGELCRDSRTSYRDLASSVKLSKDAVRRRVQTYQEEGVVDAFITRINQRLFCDAVVNAMVKTDDKESCHAFLSHHQRVNWCAAVLGDYDIAFTYFADNIATIQARLRDELDKPFVKTYDLNLYTSEHKFDRCGLLADAEHRTSNPLATQTFEALDQSILRELARNSRRSYADIAVHNDVSGATVSRRVKRMRRNGIITGFTLALRPYRFGWETYFVGATDADLRPNAIKTLKENKSVTFLTETIGYYDYLFRLSVEDQDSFQREMQEVQNVLRYPSLDIHRVVAEPKEVFVPEGPLQEDRVISSSQ